MKDQSAALVCKGQRNSTWVLPERYDLPFGIVTTTLFPCCRLYWRHRFTRDALVFGIDCFKVELGKALLPDIQRINQKIPRTPFIFGEESIDNSSGCRFFLSR